MLNHKSLSTRNTQSYDVTFIYISTQYKTDRKCDRYDRDYLLSPITISGWTPQPESEIVCDAL